MTADDWRRLWPKHCTKCGGWGGFSFVEMHGFTHGSGEQMFDLCEALPPETCHRCGEDGMHEEGIGPCKHCDWNYDDGVPEQDWKQDMTLDEIRKAVAYIEIEASKQDDEAAHTMEDGLRAEFISYVAESGPPELAEMAREVLKTDAIKFCRWCA